MAEAASRKPNIIWIFGDQHRGSALSCMQDPNVNTPHIDRMGRLGVHFPAAVAGFPLCCPFRGSLLSGRYPHRAVTGHEVQLDPSLPTVAEPFKQAGYHTAYIGKWHLDGFKERNGRAAHHTVPPERRGGFDTWVGFENNNNQWDCWVHGGQDDHAFHEKLPGYETDCLTDIMIDYIQQSVTTEDGQVDEDYQPFFAVLSVQPPHNPFLAEAEWMADHNPAKVELRPNVPVAEPIARRAREELAGYYAQIENLDWNVGRVLDTLAELGVEDDTYIVFFSDHGELAGSHGQFRKMSPYNEAIGIPFFINRGNTSYGHWGGRIPNVPINHVDIAPTSLGLAGIDVPDWMEGTDYSGLFHGKRGDYPDSAYLQVIEPTGHGDSVDKPWRGIVTTDGWKYVCFENMPFLMFDMNNDPYEQANLAHNSKYYDKHRQLLQRLREWVESTGDSFALPEDPGR
ncbi:MAG: sulfatase [Planctomycetota bacterium]